MKTKLILALVAGLAMTLSAQAANLLVNGDFEADVGDVANGTYTAVQAGQTTIDGWTVLGPNAKSGVDLIRNAYGSITNVSVDLDGTPGWGGIQQSFMAVAGQKYTLTFDYFKNGNGSDMFVTLGGATATFAVPASKMFGQTMVWTATNSGLANVVFNSDPAKMDFNGPTVDNIMLTTAPIPEPGTYALMLAGLATVGFIARRRRA